MNLSVCFNPCEMDYRAWFTVSSLTMTSLVFIYNISDRISKSNEEKFEKAIKKNDDYEEIRWRKKTDTMFNRFRLYSFLLFYLTIIGIFLFIFHLEQAGAVVISLVLVSILYLFYFWHFRMKPETIMTNSPSDIESIKTFIKTDIHYDPPTTDQPNSPESN